jgi:hypothetical protein
MSKVGKKGRAGRDFPANQHFQGSYRNSAKHFFGGFMHYEDSFRGLVKQCADAGVKLAHERCASGLFYPMFLYFKESTETAYGELMLIDDAMTVPGGFARAKVDPVRSDVPFSSYFCWVYDRALNLPVLKTGEPVCA